MRDCNTDVISEAKDRMYTADAAIELPPSLSDKQPKVAILMGTFNGQRFLPEQLDSIRQQTHKNWELYVSDDGSIDDTLNIINSVRSCWPSNQVSLWPGPHMGFVANFLSLACNLEVKADHYAFSDQDDVWNSDKLARATQWLSTIPSDTPAMYCSRTLLIDGAGNEIGFSPLFKRAPTFRNALVQSIAGANTMVFNNAARDLLIKAGPETPVVSHDWWVYMLVTGCGGKVFYDPLPSIGYRQHGNNLVGSNVGWHARYNRIAASLRGRYTAWNDVNLAALSKLEKFFPQENKKIFSAFIKLRSAPSGLRSFEILRNGLYRQTLSGNISLFAAALIGKI